MNRTLLLIFLWSIIPLVVQGSEVGRFLQKFGRIATMQLIFEQKTPGSLPVRGTLWFRRPSQLRVQYDVQNYPLLLANARGVQVVQKDLKSVYYLPYGVVPFGFLFMRPIRIPKGLRIKVRREKNRVKRYILEQKGTKVVLDVDARAVPTHIRIEKKERPPVDIRVRVGKKNIPIPPGIRFHFVPPNSWTRPQNEGRH